MPAVGPRQGPVQIPPQIRQPADQPKPKPPAEGLRAATDLGSTPTTLALSPDGGTLAVATNDLAVTLWDAAAAQQRARLPGNEKKVTTLVYSPDGRWLATADGGSFVKLREAATGKQQASIDIGGNNAHIASIAISPDSKTLLLVAGGVVKLHDLETSAQRNFLGNDPPGRHPNLFHGRFTADGNKLFLMGYRNGQAGLEQTAALWDVATGKLDEELHIFPERPFGLVLMAPDEQHFIFAAPNEAIVRVWDRTTRREATPLESKAVPTGIAFSPDGQLLLLGYGDGTVRLWDYKIGKQLAQLEANRADENLPAGDDWPLAPMQSAWAVRGLAFSADGKRLVTGKSNGFKMWDAAKAFGRPFAEAPVPVKSPENPRVKPRGAPARMGKIAGIQEMATFQAHEKNITGLALSADGRMLASAAVADRQTLFLAEAGEIKLWNLLDGRKETARTAGDAVLGFTPDGKQVLCALHMNALDFVSSAVNGGDMVGIEMALRDGRTLELRPGRVRCAGGVFSPDGMSLLTTHITAHGPVLRLYDVDTLQEVQVWKHLKATNVRALAFAPDGQSFAATLTGKTDLVICDAANGIPRITCKGHTSDVRALAFSPNGKQLASGGHDRTIKIWNTVTGTASTTLEGHTASIGYLAYAHDGRLLVSLGDDGTLRLWDTAKEKELASLELPAGNSPPVGAFLPSGKVLAAGRDKEIRLWDVSALVGPSVATPVATNPRRPSAPVAEKPAEPPPKPRTEAPRPKKAEAAAPPARAPEKGSVRESRALRISKNSYVHALVFTPDGGEVLSAGDDGRVRRWSVATGNELDSSFDAHPRVTMLSIGLSADGKLLVSSAIDRTAKVWNAADNKLLTTCDASERLPAVHAALSPDGKVLATGTNQVRLWDAASGKEIASLKGRPNFIDAVVFSADGRRLACSGSRNTVTLWDVPARKELTPLEGHTKPVMGLAFTSDGKTLASASADRTIKLWNLETNKERRTLTGHADPLSSVAFSPDGTLLVSGAGAIRFDGGRLGEVKLWDVATGQLLADLRGHSDGVSSVAFSPDGKTVASAGRDHMVRLWDVSSYAGRRGTNPP
jgi:WD40 repeat protein